MRILIDTDLEGAAGVETEESVSRGGPGFEEAYAELARDINAAVAGALEGGADEVLVMDGHGARGLDWSLIDPRAVCVTDLKAEDPYGKPFDASFFMGCHAMAGTQNAFLDHTQNSKVWFEYRVNGRPTGEIGQEAMRAGHQNAPLILVTGDEAAVAEARNFLGEIECVAVKRGIGRARCVTYDKAESRAKIRQAAARAVSELRRDPARFRPYRPALPAEMVLTVYRTDYADAFAASKPRLERIGPRTVRRMITSLQDILP